MSSQHVAAAILAIFVTCQALNRPHHEKRQILRSEVTDTTITTLTAPRLTVVYGVVGTTQNGIYEKELRAVEETWFKDVPPQRLVVAGASGNATGVIYNPAPMCQDLYRKLQPGHACREAFLITMGYDLGADWVVVAHTDNYIFPRRYEEALEKYDPKKPQIIGSVGCGAGKFCHDLKGGLCGGGTYAVSRAAMERMIGGRKTQDYLEEVTHASEVCGNWSDVTNGCVARRYDVELVVPTFIRGMVGNTISDDEVLKRVSSPEQLTFHSIGPSMMHRIRDKSLGRKTLKKFELLSSLAEIGFHTDGYHGEQPAANDQVNAKEWRKHIFRSLVAVGNKKNSVGKVAIQSSIDDMGDV